MRTALFADQLDYEQPGGIGTYLRHLVPGLAGRMEGSLVLAHHGPAEKPLFQGLAGVEEVSLGARRDVMGMAWHTLERPHLERYLGKLDLVHAPSLVFPPSKAPLAATVHDLCIVKYPGAFPSTWRIFHRMGLRLILRHARVIMADSRNTRDDLRSLMGGSDPRVRVVPLGVDLPGDPGKDEIERVLAKHGLSPGYMLFVGTLEPRKNLSRLVRAYAAFSEEEKAKSGELVLVGAPGWMGRRELARIMSQAGVRWLGFLPQDELEAVYRAASIFVYPSIYEGFGLPVLEAMARGLAVVTSDSSSLREVGEGVALLVDPNDPMELRKAMRRLLDDEDLRRELAEKGRKRAEEYPWERTVELTRQAYRDILG
ncbi:MAG: glycosyltransferase family 1 protein [Actinomycetota bacterium]|nr:glycosyltransferase family 1 protein [Actinomycetota bacterium]MDD5668031.1 glycosyltransferase family 1 protein [Actinomycetota bacterium]